MEAVNEIERRIGHAQRSFNELESRDGARDCRP